MTRVDRNPDRARLEQMQALQIVLAGPGQMVRMSAPDRATVERIYKEAQRLATLRAFRA